LALESSQDLEADSPDSHNGRCYPFKFASSNSGPAFGTKTSFVLSSPDAGSKMVTQLSLRESKRLSRQQQPGSESATSPLLAIATMTLKHHDRLSGDFVTNRAARAATTKRYFHSFFDF